MITLEPRVLAAILNFAAHNDIRYYLNAVLVERRDNRVYVCATNGHVLGLWHDKDEGPDESFLIDEPDVKSALRTFAKKIPLEISSADEGRKVVISNAITTLTFTQVEGKFPDWSCVIPRECNGEVGQFNPDLLVRFKKAATALCRDHVYVHHNGASASLVEISEDLHFVGVIMPMRATPTDPSLWLSKLP